LKEDSTPCHDALVKLADRDGCRRALDACVSDSREGEVIGLVVVKLEQLRDMNLELGYDVGDALIAEIASRLQSCLRRTDILTRTDSTEFTVILPALAGTGVPLLAAQKFLRRCTEAFKYRDRRVKPSLSFGVSAYPQDASTAEELLHHADAALRQACRGGREVVSYSECERPEDRPNIELERAFEAAIDHSELVLHFQPKVDLDTGLVTGLEALSRWPSTDGPPMPPDRFIKLAERNGLILPLTLWSFDAALRECRSWQSTLPGVSVAVNLSATLLAEPELADLVRQALTLWELPAELLTLEITESAVMSHVGSSLDALHHLSDLGVRLALDDFGTGYSSLAYLKQLPVDELKIDRVFVGDMLSTDEDRSIVQAVIDLAQNFGLTVVAEGPEDEETLVALTLMGCTQAQGYVVGRPMPVETVSDWLEDSPWKVDADLAEAASTRGR
jgi:diguanylate cyclase (GGDEF)-like protein